MLLQRLRQSQDPLDNGDKKCQSLPTPRDSLFYNQQPFPHLQTYETNFDHYIFVAYEKRDSRGLHRCHALEAETRHSLLDKFRQWRLEVLPCPR